MTQPSIYWDKPTPVGATVLDLSKLSLYNFHYNEMKPRYGNRILVTYKDTDSLLYHVETEDLYEDMKEYKHLLDLSDYPKEHPLYDPTNKKVPLTMTDELNGQVMEESVLLRSKMYSIKYQGGNKQSAKGVLKSVKKTIHHDKYLKCLLESTSERAVMTRIHSKNHQICFGQLFGSRKGIMTSLTLQPDHICQTSSTDKRHQPIVIGTKIIAQQQYGGTVACRSNESHVWGHKGAGSAATTRKMIRGRRKMAHLQRQYAIR